jgi:HPt (histidine-containing phosphotransfer) domain-containing protein
MNMDQQDIVNTKQLADLCGDDPDGSFMREMIDSYATRGPAMLASLRAAAARDDRAALQTSAHQLRGMAANLGALEVARISTALEHSLRQNNAVDIGAALDELELALNASLVVLREHARSST